MDTAAALFQAGRRGLVVLAPKGVYRNWDALEIPKHLSDDVPWRCTVWRSAVRTKAQERALEQGLWAFDGLQVLTMNVEALQTSRARDYVSRFLAAHRSLMVVDEATCIKSASADQTKAVIALGREAAYRRILTGTPITQSLLDLYAPCAFLDHKHLGFSSYFAFRARYAVLQEMKIGPTQRVIKTVVGFRNEAELHEKLRRFSSRVLKKDCIDLPPKTYLIRNVELSDEQRQAYAEMKRFALLELGGELITAPAVITQLLRLHQITCGSISTPDGRELDLPCPRIAELVSMMEETSGKVVIWANYRRAIVRIAEALAAKYGPESVATYYGETPSDARPEICARFQDEKSPLRFFVGHPRTGGFGVTLTAADTMIFYSNGNSLAERLQAEDRIHRMGQTRPCTYVDFVAPGTIDEKILQALREGIDLAETVLRDGPREWVI